MARSFNGSSDFIRLDGVRGDDLLGVMVCCWVKPTLAASGKVMARWDTGATEQWLLAVDVSGAVTGATLDTGLSGHAATSASVLTANVWQHIGLIQSNFDNLLQVYVGGLPDGAPVASGNLNQAGVETQPVFIGKSATGTFYPGNVAEATVQLVNTHLSAFAVYEEAMLAAASGFAYGECSALVDTSELIRYLPLLGDVPEPNFGAPGGTVTLNGTAVVPHPPTRSLTLGVHW